MSHRKISLELRKLAKNPKPTEKQKSLAREHLRGKDQGLAYLAAQAFAAWGGREGFQELKEWLERCLQNDQPSGLYHLGRVMADFKPNTYELSTLDKKWLKDLIVKTHVSDPRFGAVPSLLYGLTQSRLLFSHELDGLLQQLLKNEATSLQLALLKHCGHLLPLSSLDLLRKRSKNDRVLKEVTSLSKRRAQVEERLGGSYEIQTRFSAPGDIKSIGRVTGHGGFSESDISRVNGKYFLDHERYGRVDIKTAKGSGWTVLPLPAGKIPAGALPADLSKQKIVDYSGSQVSETYGMPRLFHRNEEFVCADCKKPAIFPAEVQKRWYEELGIPTYVEPSRCHDCAKKRHGLLKIDEIMGALKLDPENPDLLLEEAKYRIFSSAHTKKASLEKATSLLKKVSKLKPTLKEVLYWQAAVLENSGKPSAAKKKYQQFLDSGAKDKKLVQDAKARIAKL